MTKWQLQEAKNRLSELIRKAKEDGPQVITVRGEDAVVVVAAGRLSAVLPAPEDEPGRLLSALAARRR